MSKKIYISPSSQPANTYAVGNTNEQEQCRKIAAALEKELNRCGFNSKAGLSGTMYTRVAESNQFDADLHLPIHTNACDGDVAGLRIFVSKMGGEAEKIAKAIMATLAPITPGKSDGISVMSGLYEVRATTAICVYIEAGFHDNKEEAQWIIDHTQDIAVAIAKGLCNHYCVKYVADGKQDEPTAKEETTPKVEYAVNIKLPELQKGAECESVKAVQRILKSMGYDLGSSNPFDGDFGPKTDAAVRSYQKKNGLTSDGIVGAKTWSKLLGVN